MGEILIGLISGIVSGTGMGGGTILIFLLTFMCGVEQHIAQAANLIFFIPTSIVAIIGANLSVHTDVKNLRKYFGYFLVIIAIHEIYTIIKENKKKEKRTN